VDAALGMLGYLPWIVKEQPGRPLAPGCFRDTTSTALRAFQIDTNVIREEEATSAGDKETPALLREDGHLDPATLTSLRVRITACEVIYSHSLQVIKPGSSRCLCFAAMPPRARTKYRVDTCPEEPFALEAG